MANKTCGECKYFNTQKDKCLYPGRFYMSKSYFDACIYFEQKASTNGDKIRQGGNRALADFAFAVKMRRCNFCAYFAQQEALCQRPNDKLCSDGLIAWLNAPAESEVKNEETAIFQTEEKGEVE